MSNPVYNILSKQHGQHIVDHLYGQLLAMAGERRIVAVQVKGMWTEVVYNDGNNQIVINDEAVRHTDNLMQIIKRLVEEVKK